MASVVAPAAAPAAVDARGWGWRHAGRRAPAVRDLDLAIAPGERVLLLGPSGAGKSTLLAALAGVLGEGDDGETTGELRIDRLPPAAARGRSGLVLQDPESQVVLSRVGDEVAFGPENLGVPRDDILRRIPEALAAVGLGHLPLAHPTTRMSGGQKQRLALASVLAMRPGLLLLDEPTANLDPAGAAEVRDAVARVLDATGATLVVVEHRVDLWLDLVDRVVVLAGDGTLLADGDPASVLAARRGDLDAAGVWLPGATPRRAGSAGATGGPLLAAHRLDVARDAPLGLAVDLELRAGTTTVVAGPNGAGKSTLALTLAGLLRPAAGDLAATDELSAGAGPSPWRWSSRDLARRIGTVFQSPDHQFLASTVRDELALGPRSLGLPDPDVRADDVLDRIGLTALAAANPFTLSGGQRRRLSVGTALATAPRLLVLDEPTFGQDARSWEDVVGLLADAAGRGVGIVAASHDDRLAAALGADVLTLPSGRLTPGGAG